MDIVLGIFVGLLVLMFLIVAHEFGHFIMARKSGVNVKEFGIGFPPRVATWKRVVPKSPKEKPEKPSDKLEKKWKKLPKSEWGKEQSSLIFSINALPIGGFCAMDGESDADTRKGTFGSVSYWKKTKILFGGVAMNWLIAFLILLVLSFFGLPELLPNQFSLKADEHKVIVAPVEVDSVLENSPAEKAGFKHGDVLKQVSVVDPTVHVSGEGNASPITTIETSSDVINFNNSHPAQTVYYLIERNSCLVDCVQEPCECTSETLLSKSTEVLEVELNNSDAEYLLGVTMSYGSVKTRYTWSAPVVAAGLTVQLTGETFKGLWNLLVNLVTGTARQVSFDQSVRQEGREQISEASEGVTGIVGILGGYFPSLIKSGPSMIFLFMAVISISLACMNVLPIPALDGGRWLMITLARLRKKKLSQETEQKIVARAFIVLLALMLVITILDIIRLF
ncbi:site-2 protease family protein [Candidatus Saccharibacteria bacterium]|nr:site-2 protease family protein [Candidatus Saccharibacteria bacterium]